MGSVYRRGRICWIAYYRNNIQIRETTRTRDEVEARKILRIREGDIARGLPITNKSQKLRFQELIDDVRTDYIINSRRSLASWTSRVRLHIEPYFGKLRASQIDTPLMQQYIKNRLEEHAAPATINRELGVIGRAFELGRQLNKVMVPPHIPNLKESNVRRGFFEDAALDALCAHLPEYLVAPVRFAHLTGWRVSEIRQLEWRHIDFEAGEISLDPGTTKNDEGRVFPMTCPLRALLSPLRVRRSIDKQAGLTPRVFLRRMRGGRVFPLGDFRKAWAMACFKAGLPVVAYYKRDAQGATILTTEGPRKGLPLIERIDAEAIFHDLRRTAVRNLVRKGVHERVAMAMCGHKTREVFDRYNIVSRSDLAAARELLDRIEHSPSTIQAVAVKEA